MTFQSDIQSPALGKLIELFDVDMTELGGSHFFLTPGLKDNTTAVEWRGNTYQPFPVEASGFEVSGKGQFPRPRFRISNVLRLAEEAINSYDELLGAIVTRWRVFEKNLDNGDDPDPDSHFPVEMYKINRRVGHNAMFIEFELASFIDQEGKMIPGRQIANICTHTYRKFNTDTQEFDYANVTCPYTGESCFNAKGELTTAENDRCSKKLKTGCAARFGSEPLPFQGFVGLKKPAG